MAIGDSARTLHRYIFGTNSARPKNGTYSRFKYSLLAPMGPEVNAAAEGNQVSGDGHKAIRGFANQACRET